MNSKPPELILIAGPNGAGKSTFAEELLTRELKGYRFLNADDIARGLSPFDPSSLSFKAGRILINEANELISKRKNFALESTISGISQVRLIKKAKAAGYQVTLHFLWLPSAKASISRVKLRVSKGGHNIPKADIKRRHSRILKNLMQLYLPIVDQWAIYDSSFAKLKFLANNYSHAINELNKIIKK